MTDNHSKESTKSDLAVQFFCCIGWASRRLFLMLWSFLFFFFLVQVTKEVVKLLELKLYLRYFVSFWCHCISQFNSDLEGGKNTKKYLPWCLSPNDFSISSVWSVCIRRKCYIWHSGKRLGFFITKKPIPNKTEHLEEAKGAQTFAILCYLLACIYSMSLLLKYYCVLHRAAMMEWYLPVI